MTTVKKHRTWVIGWLALCAALVVGMVLVGGYTRLSGSGLSITEWKPIHGVIPPLSETEWQEEFDKYKQIPQYAEVNKGMTVDEFKTIFWPEFWHRILGRSVGIVFFLPLIFFWVTGSISHRFGFRMLGIFVLGGLQGFMGWYMVASGLSENIYVSHFRLAAHFSLALLIFALILWQILSLSRAQTRELSLLEKDPSASLRVNLLLYWFALLCLQILYGAFMAGLHAGLLYNTWPDMNGAAIPEGIWALSHGWINLFENHTTVQFIHRTVAILVVLGFAFWWFVNRRYVKSNGLAKLASRHRFRARPAISARRVDAGQGGAAGFSIKASGNGSAVVWAVSSDVT